MNEALRYSDKDLTEFKKLIEEKILNAEKDLKHFQNNY